MAAGVTLNAASIRPVGVDPQGWFQVNVEVPFRFDMLETLDDLEDYIDSARASTFGTWQDPLVLGGAGGLYIWYSGGVEYRKTGAAPTSATDGEEWMGGAIV